MKFLLRVFATIFGIAGIGTAVIAKLKYPSLSGWEPHAYTTLVCAPFIIGSAFAISRSKHVSLIGAFSRPMIFAWVGCIGLIAGGIEYTNGSLDSSEGVPHTVKVTAKKITKGKKSDSYSIIVSSWREGHTTEKLDVPESLYNTLVAGSSEIEVISHAGALGMEWVEPLRDRGAFKLIPATL